MRILHKVAVVLAISALLAGGAAGATTLHVEFPEVNGADLPNGPYAAQAIGVVRTLAIPRGERIVSATISGTWGSSAYPLGTAGVNVLLDDVLVASCLQGDPNCYADAPSARPWTHVFTESELQRLNDGVVTLYQQQTSGNIVRLGKTVLAVSSEVPPVPALSPFGLAALFAAMAAVGAFVLRRRNAA